MSIKPPSCSVHAHSVSLHCVSSGEKLEVLIVCVCEGGGGVIFIYLFLLDKSFNEIKEIRQQNPPTQINTLA